MKNQEKHWTLLVKIHNLTKTLVIHAEEIDRDHEFYFPIIIQQRDCLDHIIRAAFAEFYPEELTKGKNGISDTEKYTEHQMEKALGHMYRAFFDAADWMGILCRERIADTMSVYSVKTIHNVFPSYVSEIKPRIEAISLEIAKVRNSKDIGHTNEVIEGADHYVNIIEELTNYIDIIQKVLPDLNKFEFDQI